MSETNKRNRYWRTNYHWLLGKDNELNILADKYDEIVETDYK